MCGRLGGSRALPCERVLTAMKRDSTGDHKHEDIEPYPSMGRNVGPIANEYALMWEHESSAVMHLRQPEGRPRGAKAEYVSMKTGARAS